MAAGETLSSGAWPCTTLLLCPVPQRAGPTTVKTHEYEMRRPPYLHYTSVCHHIHGGRAWTVRAHQDPACTLAISLVTLLQSYLRMCETVDGSNHSPIFRLKCCIATCILRQVAAYPYTVNAPRRSCAENTGASDQDCRETTQQSGSVGTPRAYRSPRSVAILDGSKTGVIVMTRHRGRRGVGGLTS